MRASLLPTLGRGINIPRITLHSDLLGIQSPRPVSGGSMLITVFTFVRIVAGNWGIPTMGSVVIPASTQRGVVSVQETSNSQPPLGIPTTMLPSSSVVIEPMGVRVFSTLPEQVLPVKVPPPLQYKAPPVGFPKKQAPLMPGHYIKQPAPAPPGRRSERASTLGRIPVKPPLGERHPSIARVPPNAEVGDGSRHAVHMLAYPLGMAHSGKSFAPSAAGQRALELRSLMMVGI